MKVIGKILKILGILLLALVLLLAAADAAWIYVPQIKAAKRIDDVDAYAAPVEALTVREGAGIIALGEATHGNAEFQRLRRDVLERLTEEYGILRGGTDGIAPAAVCGRHATPYGTEYLVRRTAVPAGMALGQVNIEDLFVFMAKEA